MDAMLRWVSSVLSPSGKGARLTIVTFHRVLDVADPLQPELPTRQEFSKRLTWLKNQFRILPLDQACDDLFSGRLQDRCAAITFDDGYRDNLSNALPEIKKNRLTATVFVATGFSRGNNMFNDEIVEAVRNTKLEAVDASEFGLGRLDLGSTQERLAAIEGFVGALKYSNLLEREQRLAKLHQLLRTREAQPLMMSEDDIRSLSQHGVTIGAHTRNHPILLRESDETARYQILESQNDIARITGIKPRLFAFPNGKRDDDFSIKHCAMVKQAGFDYGFTTDPASASMNTDRYRLPRVSMWAPNRLRTGLSLISNLREDTI